MGQDEIGVEMEVLSAAATSITTTLVSAAAVILVGYSRVLIWIVRILGFLEVI